MSIISLEQMFPLIGKSWNYLYSLIALLVTGIDNAVQIAVCHFNVTGVTFIP